MSLRFSALMIATALLGAGCFSKPETTPATDGSTSSTFQVNIPEKPPEPPAPTSTEPEPPRRWDHTKVFRRGVVFTPPKGYWVYFWGNSQRYYLVPGTAPAPGSPDPGEDPVKKAVASFYEVRDDVTSFPSWRRFGLTMAQFDCAKGTNDKDFINCGEDVKNETEAKTDGQYPYWQFTLPAFLQATHAPRGSRTFQLVRLGDRTFGILVAVVEGKSAAPAAALVKSMKGE